MLVLNYVILFVIIISLGILYQKYLEKQSRTISFNEYGEIEKYILKNDNLDSVKKPILWIHIHYEYNSRQWISFGSRNTNDLNQPYLYLTVKSIIKNCDESFKIVLIDDGSFEKLIPDWNIDMTIVGDPLKSYIRQLAITKLLYNYGGLNVPISFLCFRDLISLYKLGVNDDSMFVCENYNSNVTSTNKLFHPSISFMGTSKQNNTIKQLIDLMERNISTDYTSETNFLGTFDAWCQNKITKGKMRLIPGTDIGTRTIDDKPVTVDTLLGQDYIQFYAKTYGIWIPDKMILKRTSYEWFARMSPEQIFESQFILAKYFVLALAPDSHMGVIEPEEKVEPKWVDFWRVPFTY